MQQIINNGESGLEVRNALNDNFTELYSSLIIPIKLTVTGNQTQAISQNTFITTISLTPSGGTPTLDIGTTNGGGEILPSMPITSFTPIVVQLYFPTAGILYFNLSGVGSVNVRIDYIPNYI